MSLTRLTAGVLACTTLVAPSLAQGKPFKHALPAKTLVFFSAPDLNSSLTEFQNTAFAKMWREEEMQDFVKDALDMAHAKMKEGMGQLTEMHKAGQIPISAEDLQSLRVNSFTGALTGFEVKAGQFGPQPHVGLLAHIDFGASAATWRKLVDFGLGALMAQAGGQAERKSTKLEGDVELVTIAPNAETAMALNLAFVSNGIIIGTITDEVKAAVASVLGQKTVLPKDPNYMATTKHLSTSGAEFEAYVNVASCVDVFMGALKFAEGELPNWPEELKVAGIDRALSALGMRSVKASGFTSKYSGSKAESRAFGLSPSGDRKGFVASGGKAVDLSFLKWVPKDVASLSAYSMNISSIYDGLVAALKAYDPENPDLANMLLGQLGEYEKQFGISLKDDLFGVFGDQAVSWSMGVSSFMSAPEGAMLMKIKDQERLLKTLKKVAAMTGGIIDFPDSERRGVKTWRLEIDPEAIPQQMAPALQVMQMVQPCFAFKDGYMILALSTGDVRRMIKRMGREEDPASDIRSNKEFAGYLKDMMQTPVSSFSWTDWKVSFESLYSAGTSALALVVSDDQIPFNMTLLPEAETLSQHLFSSMTWSKTTDEGYMTESISPVGPELMVGAAVLAVGGGVAAVMGQRRAPMAMAAPIVVEEAQPAEEQKTQNAGKKKD